MEKKKFIVKIRSFSAKDGMLLLEVQDFGARRGVKDVVELCEKKYSSYIHIEASPPYRKRTTDVGGQNRHIWGHLQQIANETGNDVADVEEYIKMKAVKRGYPYHVNKLTGQMKPDSMRTINTVQAGCLIDELHQLAAELGITLDES